MSGSCTVGRSVPRLLGIVDPDYFKPLGFVDAMVRKITPDFSSGGFDLDEFILRAWWRHHQALLSERSNMQYNRLANEANNLLLDLPNGDATREVGDVCAPVCHPSQEQPCTASLPPYSLRPDC